VPKLLHRFWSNEGYTLLSDVPLVLRGVRNLQGLIYDRVVVGVITNSDDRVPDILTSLGVKVGRRRYGQSLEEVGDSKVAWDIDFAVMSYDVGVEKPEKGIFDAACKMAGSVSADVEEGGWAKVYVGDEYGKDVVGANGAGWNAVLIAEDVRNDELDVLWRDDDRPSTLAELFESSKAVGFRSLGKLAEWLR
jgi:hypothetical protein